MDNLHLVYTAAADYTFIKELMNKKSSPLVANRPFITHLPCRLKFMCSARLQNVMI
jgi:hypothetical protein